MKNDNLLKYRMLNAEEVNREIFKDFIRYGFAAYAWGHTAYSIFCTDPIARANQRGYGLR